MAKDLNKVMIIGRLGADPEARFTPAGTAVTTFRVAAGRQWKSADGATQEETEWFRVVAWDRLAEFCRDYLAKGRRVYVEGRLRTRTWQDQDGQDRAITEVIASDVILLDSYPATATLPVETADTVEDGASPTATTHASHRHERVEVRRGSRRASAAQE
jgi:single-strand DNA-binding protein